MRGAKLAAARTSAGFRGGRKSPRLKVLRSTRGVYLKRKKNQQKWGHDIFAKLVDRKKWRLKAFAKGFIRVPRQRWGKTFAESHSRGKGVSGGEKRLVAPALVKLD